MFYSGVAADIRKEVWKFLLGLYPASSTAAERADILKQKRLHYGRIKAQWTSIAPEQAAKWVLLTIIDLGMLAISVLGSTTHWRAIPAYLSSLHHAFFSWC